MQVLKFGGTSIANAHNVNLIIDIVRRALAKDKCLVVASAISGCTDRLIQIGQTAAAHDLAYTGLIDSLEAQHRQMVEDLFTPEYREDIVPVCATLFKDLRDVCKGAYLLREISLKTLDHIMSFGELLSTQILSAKFKAINIDNRWIDAREIIKTYPHQGRNQVNVKKTGQLVRNALDRNYCKLYIVPGFIASDEEGRTTTLGRGGSDYTASLLAVACDARALEIWTDVSGIMTADPHVVPEARTIENISYKDAQELSHFGAKVVYPPTIQPVVNRNIPIYIKNTFDPTGPCTLIERNPPEHPNKICGISSSDRIALLSMEGSDMVGVPGYSSRLFDTLSKHGIDVILITQASSVHTMCVAIDEADADKAQRAVDDTFAYEISLGKVDPLKVEKGYSIISLVGDDMQNQSGSSGRMFEALGRCGINIRAIAQGSSEKNLSTVVATRAVKPALRAIHQEFFNENKDKTVHLFLAGFGGVGRALLEILRTQQAYLYTKYGKKLVVVGLANSRRFVIDPAGLNLDPAALEQALAQGEPNVANSYIDHIIAEGLPTSIFVDCTADKYISQTYGSLFERGIAVVACNKIAGASPLHNYQYLRESAIQHRVGFRYETTAGAALPIISVINQMLNCGDKLHSCRAVLSGTLNYLFSCYNGTESFASLVKKARLLGYTEPDPRLDLCGSDVLRKCLILAREAEVQLEVKDVEQREFLPADFFEGSLEDFYAKVEAYEPHIKALYDQASAQGRRLRYVASLDILPQVRASMGLEAVDQRDPLYSLEGTDNEAVLKSEFYPSPLSVRGAGAGTRQTASGILNDLLSIC